MMKTKHYIYARLITALLSTSSIAGIAVSDDANVISSIKNSCTRIGGQPIINEDQKNHLLNQSKNFSDKIQNQDDEVSGSEYKNVRNSTEEIDDDIVKLAGFKRQDVDKFADLSSLAYSNQGNRRILFNEYQAKGYKISHFGTDREESGFILSKGTEVIVSYRGTASLRDLAVDLNGFMNTSSFTQGRFHTGFYHEFKDSWEEAYTVINAHARKNNLDLQDLKLTFTGHSLGGGLAGIAALRWAEKNNADNVSLITYAAPKFCDTKTARRVEELFGDRILRITQHGFDIVPGVGPGIMGYQAVGHNLRVTAERWDHMHFMEHYKNSLNNLNPWDFKIDNSVRSIFIGGFYNPLNVVDSFIKYGVNEMVVGNVQSGFSMFRKKIFGTSELIENVFLTKGKSADKLFNKKLAQNISRNLKILQADRLALDSDDTYAIKLDSEIKQAIKELKSIEDSDTNQIIEEFEFMDKISSKAVVISAPAA